MVPPDYIGNYAAVVAFYGYWPSFHDAQVHAYETSRDEAASLCFTLHTWRMTNEVDEKGYFILRNHSLVSFRFDGVHDADMDSFGAGNILFGLHFSRAEEPAAFRVDLDSVMDMSGTFSASSGEVVSVVPCDSDGTPLATITGTSG